MLDIHLGDETEVHPVFSPDGRYLAVPTDRGTLVYEVRGPDHLGMLAPHGRTLQTFVVSADNQSADKQRLALAAGKVGDKDATITLWNAAGARCDRQWVIPVAAVAEPATLSLHRSDPLLAWSNGNDKLRFCRTNGSPEQEEIGRIIGRRFTFSPAGGRLWGIVDGNKLVAWKLPNFEVAVRWDNSFSQFLSGHSNIDCLAVSAHWAAAGCGDGTAVMVDAETGRIQPLPFSGRQAVSALAISRDECLASVGGRDGTMAVVRISDGAVLHKLDDLKECILTLAFSSDGDLLAVGYQNGSVRVFGKQGEERFSLLISLDGHPGPVTLVQFAPDGKGLYVLVQGETALRIWKLGQLRNSLSQLGLSW